MRVRRRSRVVWSSSRAPVSRSNGRGRLAPRARTWWWLRTSALLTVIGVRWLLLTTRAHRREALLTAGTLLTVLSIALGSMATFVGGLLIWALARPWHWDEQAGK